MTGRRLEASTAALSGVVGVLCGALFDDRHWFGAIAGGVLFALVGFFVGRFWPPSWSRWGAALVAAALGFFLLATIGVRPFG